MLIKVCGMREPDNIRRVAEAGADWMGFIFYARSPRFAGNLSPDEISKERAVRRPPVRVGVFVDATPEYMMEMGNKYALGYLQLHGNESPDTCYALQKRGYAIIKAFSIADEEDLKLTADYEGRADYFLFDTKCEQHGGSGNQFDWSMLNSYKGKKPFLLSGGINPYSPPTLKELRHPQLAGFDLNSRFETKPGLKDVERLRHFLEELRK